MNDQLEARASTDFDDKSESVTNFSNLFTTEEETKIVLFMSADRSHAYLAYTYLKLAQEHLLQNDVDAAMDIAEDLMDSIEHFLLTHEISITTHNNAHFEPAPVFDQDDIEESSEVLFQASYSDIALFGLVVLLTIFVIYNFFRG